MADGKSSKHDSLAALLYRAASEPNPPASKSTTITILRLPSHKDYLRALEQENVVSASVAPTGHHQSSTQPPTTYQALPSPEPDEEDGACWTADEYQKKIHIYSCSLSLSPAKVIAEIGTWEMGKNIDPLQDRDSHGPAIPRDCAYIIVAELAINDPCGSVVLFCRRTDKNRMISIDLGK
jgi:hypothetical protein